jgi:hypothetical protein
MPPALSSSSPSTALRRRNSSQVKPEPGSDQEDLYNTTPAQARRQSNVDELFEPESDDDEDGEGNQLIDTETPGVQLFKAANFEITRINTPVIVERKMRDLYSKFQCSIQHSFF